MPALCLLTTDPFTRQALQEALEGWGMAATQADIALVDAEHPPHVIPTDKPILWLGKPAAPEKARWLAKPFTLQQLRKAIESVALASQPICQEGIALGLGCMFHAAERRINTADGIMITLTEKETMLLAELLQAGAAGKRREELMHKVWGYSEQADTHTLETHIYRLRGKLKECGLAEVIGTTPEGYACLCHPERSAGSFPAP